MSRVFGADADADVDANGKVDVRPAPIIDVERDIEGDENADCIQA